MWAMLRLAAGRSRTSAGVTSSDRCRPIAAAVLAADAVVVSVSEAGQADAISVIGCAPVPARTHAGRRPQSDRSSMSGRSSAAARPSKIALPLTMMSAPMAATRATLSRVTPPSTPSRIGRPRGLDERRAASSRRSVAGMEALAAPARVDRQDQDVVEVVEERLDRRRRRARVERDAADDAALGVVHVRRRPRTCRTRCGCGAPSMWKVIMSAPAATNASIFVSGSSIIR